MIDSSGSITSPSGAVTTLTGSPTVYATSAVSSFIRLPTDSWVSALSAARTVPVRWSKTA